MDCTGQKPKQHPILLRFAASCLDQWVKQKSQWPRPGQRSAKGHNRSMTFNLHRLKILISSNGKTNTVNMLYMVRDTKVSTVTPTSDPVKPPFLKFCFWQNFTVFRPFLLPPHFFWQRTLRLLDALFDLDQTWSVWSQKWAAYRVFFVKRSKVN